MDTDSFVLGVTTENNIKNMEKFYHLFDFRILSDKPEIFSKEENQKNDWKIYI